MTQVAMTQVAMTQVAVNRVATLLFVGRFRSESFFEFVRHRAERLSLKAAAHSVGPDRIQVSVAGDQDLVDAFELACSLGPIDCLVLDHHRLGIADAAECAGQYSSET